MFNNKRYRIHNNYLTIGAGFFNSTLRTDVQKNVTLDFNFHIHKQHFQTGIAISGYAFLENNQTQAKLGYGYRKESTKYNFAAFAGPTFFTGVYAIKDSANTFKPEFYQGIGAYICAQVVTKLSYDIGIGGEVFAEINYKQKVIGFKFLLFFSGAYRGVKRNFNPHVKSELKK